MIFSGEKNYGNVQTCLKLEKKQISNKYDLYRKLGQLELLNSNKKFKMPSSNG